MEKYIAQFLIFVMIISLIPEYVGAALKEYQQNLKAQSSEHFISVL